MSKWTKEFRREYYQRYYEDRKESYKKTQSDAAKRRAAAFQEFKKTLSCERCGENHPATLDFHHRDPTQKDKAVSAVAAKWSLARLEAEIAKCMVLCANCHRKLHADEMPLKHIQ